MGRVCLLKRFELQLKEKLKFNRRMRANLDNSLLEDFHFFKHFHIIFYCLKKGQKETHYWKADSTEFFIPLDLLQKIL